ncbi:hypothetical protein AVEN_238225-1 [Araneus ventricosus]|uniref:CCHC-type domain-containing protein n=1 Tax=Araneus ventricosus TaxID=182803 RepID=A0A4Y2I5F6_ARAVE|nr:hypothetical protein AVEN_238225-1 [Araneus ventricosus]
MGTGASFISWLTVHKGWIRSMFRKTLYSQSIKVFQVPAFWPFQNKLPRDTCACCAAAGHESTDCTAVEKCVHCGGKHTSFSRSCPKWKVEKEIVAAKFKNNISFPEARRLVKAQTPPDGKSYASVVDKDHPVYQTTNCPHCNHLVTMSNPVPSTPKSPEPVTIASSSDTKYKISYLNPALKPQEFYKTHPGLQ